MKLFPYWSRHRSHHTQKVIPSAVARHQFLDTSLNSGLFPILKIRPGLCVGVYVCHFEMATFSKIAYASVDLIYLIYADHVHFLKKLSHKTLPGGFSKAYIIYQRQSSHTTE